MLAVCGGLRDDTLFIFGLRARECARGKGLGHQLMVRVHGLECARGKGLGHQLMVRVHGLECARGKGLGHQVMVRVRDHGWVSYLSGLSTVVARAEETGDA